jgi:hypothetical protein
MMAQNETLEGTFPRKQARQGSGGGSGKGSGGRNWKGNGSNGGGGASSAADKGAASRRQDGEQEEAGSENGADGSVAGGGSVAAAQSGTSGGGSAAAAGGAAAEGKEGGEDEEAGLAEMSSEEEDTEGVGISRVGRRLQSDVWIKYKGKPAFNRVLDLVVHHPDVSKGPKAMTIPGRATLFAEARKLNHYNRTYDIPSDQLVPFALDTWGTIGPRGTDFLKFVAFESCNPTSSATPPPYAVRLRRLVERVAVVLQLANAEVVRVMRTQLAADAGGLAAAGVGPVGE